MADEEKKEEKTEEKTEEKKGSRPNSAASSKSAKSDKSHKSDKSDKSHKSDKSDKSHKSDKSDKSHKSHKSDKSDKSKKSAKNEETTEEVVVQETVTNAEETPAAAENKLEEATPPAATEVPVKAETTEVTDCKEDGAPAEPEPVHKEKSELELLRAKSVVLAELSDEEIERFEALFEMYATDEGGKKKISSQGIKMLFRFMGEIVNEAILSQWLKEEDKDVDGVFDFEEFCSLYKKKRQPEDKRREDMLMCVNKLFPSTGGPDDDFLSLDKVSSVVKQINSLPALRSERTTLLTDTEVDDVISRADVDNNKKISRQEFVNFLCSLE